MPNHCAERREGEGLGGFDHMRTLMTRSVSMCMSMYESPKERDRSLDQRAGRLFEVLYRWFDGRTRLPANFMIPRALESLRTIIIGSWQPTLYEIRSSRAQSVKTLAGMSVLEFL